MSLIQEALKRQHEEFRSREGESKLPKLPPEPAEPVQPAVPQTAVSAELPAESSAVPLKLKPQKTQDVESADNAGAEDEPGGISADGSPSPGIDEALHSGLPATVEGPFVDSQKKRLKLLFIVGGITAAVIIIAALIWVAGMAFRSINQSTAEISGSAGKKPAIIPPVGKTLASSVKPASTEGKQEKKTVEAAPQAKLPETPPPVQVANAATVPPPVLPPKPQPKETNQWPILVIKGLLGTDSGKGGAIINNEIVNVGQEIQGVKVVSIGTAGTVILSFKGQARTLRIGDITN